MGWNEPPRMVVQRTGSRERGFMAWRAWVSHGPMRYCGEHGTYAWTRKGAERKARRLLAKWHKTQSGPEIEVTR
jgi:hypothetical protein